MATSALAIHPPLPKGILDPVSLNNPIYGLAVGNEFPQ
jgi:hypothetical protein